MEQQLPTVHLLKMVIEARHAHGAREQHYVRYRNYTKRKLKRVRHALKMQNSYKCRKGRKAVFKKTKLESYSEERSLELTVFEAERRWAQAMDIKQQLEDDPKLRKRHAMRSSLKRAVQHVDELERLSLESPRLDARTRLECAAYARWLRGIVRIEFREWEAAAAQLNSAMMAYEQLAPAAPDSSLYTSKCEELASLIRLCERGSSTSVPKSAQSTDGSLRVFSTPLMPDETFWLTAVQQMIAHMQASSMAQDAVRSAAEGGEGEAKAGRERGGGAGEAARSVSSQHGKAAAKDGDGKVDAEGRKRRRRKRVRLPKNFDPNVPPDPERWLPRCERAAYRKKRKNRDREMGRGTQGVAATAVEFKGSAQQAYVARIVGSSSAEGPRQSAPAPQKKKKVKGGKAAVAAVPVAALAPPPEKPAPDTAITRTSMHKAVEPPVKTITKEEDDHEEWADAEAGGELDEKAVEQPHQPAATAAQEAGITGRLKSWIWGAK